MHSESSYKEFASKVLSVDFDDIQTLICAFTHRSYVNEHRKTVFEHNERLEFLGDAVLELVVTDFLYKNYKDAEGVLTNWRSSLVRTESIGQAAAKHDFEPLLRLSKGEKRGTDRARQQILANCYEAVVGAIYVDQGYEAAEKFITKSLISTFDNILETGSWMDAKSHLQETAQSKDNSTPIYKVLEEVGPDHDKEFTVGAFINGEIRGKGKGPSKQIGQQNAAEIALESYSDHK